MSEKTDTETLNRILRQYKFAADLTSPICILNSKRIITYVNDRFCKIFGYSAHESIGQSLDIIHHDETQGELAEQMWETVNAKKIFRGKLRHQTKEGNSNMMDVYAIPIIGADKNISEYILMMRDVTAYEMEKKKREANIVKSKADMMNRFKKEKILLENRVKDAERQSKFQNQEMKNALLEAEKLRSRADTLALKLKETSSLVSFNSIFMSEVIRAKRYGRPFSVIAFGIDRVEAILDACDKDYMVDKMVYKYKSIVQSTVRVCDYVVRDGDTYNFIMLLPETPGPGAKRAIEKINEKLQKELPKFEGRILTTTWVIGELENEREDADMILAEAKTMLEDAKTQGRNRILLLNEFAKSPPVPQIPAAYGSGANTPPATAAAPAAKPQVTPATAATPPPQQTAMPEPTTEPEDHIDDDDFMNDDFFDDDF